MFNFLYFSILKIYFMMCDDIFKGWLLLSLPLILVILTLKHYLKTLHLPILGCFPFNYGP